MIPNSRSRLVLVCAPAGRDTAVAVSLLNEIGVQARPTSGIVDLTAAVGDDTCFAVITEEALRGTDLKELAAKLAGQPSWSDLPFIVLTHKGGGPERNPAAARLAEILGNVSFLERPFHPTTFVSVANTALKNRHRQYEARARIEDLHEGEQRLKIALAAGHLGSWELDIDAQELTLSDTCKTAFGRSPEDEFGYRDLLAAIHPDDKPRVLTAIQATVETGRDYIVEYRTLWPSGGDHWIEVRARRTTGRHKRPVLVGVSLDITARKLIEYRLAAANDMLEQRVAERTHELEQAHARVLEEIAQRERTEEQLRQAQKMEMIGQLTGGVAHDFNNLLMAVIANLDLLKRHVADDPRTMRLIDGAIQGANRGASLTQRLLAFARRQELKLVPMDITDLVRGIGDLLTKSVGAQIELRYELRPDLAPTLVDTNQVELALLNLVVNARDAMPDGGSVTISTDQVMLAGDVHLPDGVYLSLTVTDTGIGMSEETLAKATEPFFSTKELGKGTGLGLSMIHGLAIQLNGALRLSSKLNEGTRAEFLIPATEVGAPVPEPVAEARPRQVGSQKTILVVDDDPLIAMSTVDLLEDLGHVVIEANSGAEALQFVESGRKIDLVITDYSMPKMNGGQLASALRSTHPDLPILLATGYAELPPGTEIDLPRLSKPYDQQQLEREIAKLLDR